MADVRKRRVATQGAWGASRDRLLSSVRRLSRRYVKVLPELLQKRPCKGMVKMMSEVCVRSRLAFVEACLSVHEDRLIALKERRDTLLEVLGEEK